MQSCSAPTQIRKRALKRVAESLNVPMHRHMRRPGSGTRQLAVAQTAPLESALHHNSAHHHSCCRRMLQAPYEALALISDRKAHNMNTPTPVRNMHR